MNGLAHRTGLAVGALALVATLASAFVLDGYLTGQRQAAPATASPAGALDAAAVAPDPSVVYVRPAPSAQVIQVTETASPPPAPVIHVIVPGHGGDDDSGRDDD